jgi:hypothetical protein
MADSADPPAFHCRRDEREAAAVWRLGPDALIRTEANGATTRMTYAEMRELRLLYDPARPAPHRFRCDVSSAAGYRVALMSMSFIAPEVYEDRSSRYTPFVRELVRRVGTASPHCRFAAGQTPWSFYGGHALALAGIVIMAHLAARFGALPPHAALILKTVMIVAYVAAAARTARHTRPRRFAPQDIPASMLP